MMHGVKGITKAPSRLKKGTVIYAARYNLDLHN